MVVCVSHGYPPGDVELFSSSGYQTLILHTSQYTTTERLLCQNKRVNVTQFA